MTDGALVQTCEPLIVFAMCEVGRNRCPNMKRWTVAALLIAVLGACAPEFNPPPGYRGGFLANSGRSFVVTVKPGDTVYAISRRYDVPTQTIISRNGLQPPYHLQVGQQLILDPIRIHRVMRGDTLSRLARSYGVDMGLLASMNELSSPYTIYVGQDLYIPDPFSVAAAPVQRNVSPRQSPGVQPRPSTTVPPPPTAEVASPPEKELVEVVPPISAPPARASARFAWPITGRIISRFGPAGPGLHNDGINIAASAGASVRAADNGVVAYAGSELRGFGNLLLIKHDGGWITAYAHNDALLVKRGEQVKQGQVIARVGQSGNVDAPQLHFEVRKGTQALDPIQHLAQAPGG